MDFKKVFNKEEKFKTASLNSAHAENEQVTGTDNGFCWES